MMGVRTNQIISLKKLSEEHCWLIFSQLAFMDTSAKERPQLEPIGLKIAAKSRGLPLVAKTLGSLMRFKKTENQWEDILGSQLWDSNDAKVMNVFAPFLLSYYDLPPLEKHCFLYCSVFPQDFVIVRDDLIEMWMSHGYLGRGVESWKLGRDCFESLAMRSFFQEINENVHTGGLWCKMHDIVHDFAHFLTGDEFVLIEVGEDGEDNKAVVKENTRHLTLKSRCPNSLGNVENLRTLFFQTSVFDGLYGKTLLFSQLPCLRTLIMQSCEFELSEDIGLLKHLRYLDISYNQCLEELPKKLFYLCNLETLKLCCCFKLKTLPECISKLVNLKHLYVTSCPLEGLPKGLRKLSALRTLDMIVVPEERESYLNIGDLKHLQPRAFLRITGCGNAGTKKDDVVKMNLNGITVLELSFRYHSKIDSNNHNDTEILNSIHPHPNLKSLEIENYLGLTVSPAWMMSLSNLTHLGLTKFANCETLPPLGKLPSLKELELYEFPKMCTVGEEFLGITEADREVVSFPKLEELTFYDNQRWRVWEGSCTNGTIIMPCLCTLNIHGGPSLETLPEFLKTTPLQYLSIIVCDTLKEHCKKEVGKEWHKISHVPNIEFDCEYLQKDGVWIQTDEAE